VRTWAKSNRQVGAYILRIERGPVAAHNGSATVQQNETVGQPFGEIKVLLDEHNGHVATITQQRDDPLNVLDNGGLNALSATKILPNARSFLARYSWNLRCNRNPRIDPIVEIGRQGRLICSKGARNAELQLQ
jgi:hypothetical protein